MTQGVQDMELAMPTSGRDTERTSLLVSLDEPKPKPLPWRPIVVLLMVSAAQPVAYDLVFPFISMSERTA